jgi:tryptophanyl-tRNA synthetase
MSKSYNNAIYLSDSAEKIAATVAQMITDPQRGRRSDPGNPDVCNVFSFHKLYTDAGAVSEIDTQCRNAEIGCVECKKIMAENLIKALEPIREKRRYYESRLDLVEEIIHEGSNKARIVAQKTMEEVRSVVKI